MHASYALTAQKTHAVVNWCRKALCSVIRFTCRALRVSFILSIIYFLPTYHNNFRQFRQKTKTPIFSPMPAKTLQKSTYLPFYVLNMTNFSAKSANSISQLTECCLRHTTDLSLLELSKQDCIFPSSPLILRQTGVIPLSAACATAAGLPGGLFCYIGISEKFPI